MKKRLLTALLALLLAVCIPYSASAAVVWGDANGDGRFSAKDAVAVLQYVADRGVAVTSTADVSGDSEVTAYDVSLLLRGLIKPSVVASGFELDFDADVDYYLCYPENFSACVIKKYAGFTQLEVQVEQRSGYRPYGQTAYVRGEPLKLGYGRATLTLTGTRPDGTTHTYSVYLTDPNGQEYACVRGRITANTALRSEPHSKGAVLAQLKKGDTVLYLETAFNWTLVQLSSGEVGYVYKTAVQRQWKEVAMPAAYKTAVEALKAAHPNWRFTFVDVEMTMAEAQAKYGASNAWYIDPVHYLNESKIFAMLDVQGYTGSSWTEVGVSNIWRRTNAVSKADAVAYFTTAARALDVNPYYIACRAALESGYGSSRFAQGAVNGYEGYYNFYGISCFDSNPSVGAAYAKKQNWNSMLRSVVEGAAWVKQNYIDQGAVTPYFFRFAGFQKKEYMTDVTAPMQEAAILRRAYTNSQSTAHFIIPVYR